MSNCFISGQIPSGENYIFGDATTSGKYISAENIGKIPKIIFFYCVLDSGNYSANVRYVMYDFEQQYVIGDNGRTYFKLTESTENIITIYCTPPDKARAFSGSWRYMACF